MSDESLNSKIETIGQVLRRARESKGLSVEQVSSATKIHVKIIQDLEMDRYDLLPAAPFTRGFIYNYSRFLGLSSKKLMDEHKVFLEEKWNKHSSKSRVVTGYAFERPEGEQSRNMLWAVMGGMFVLGVLVIVIFKPALKHKKHGHVSELKINPPAVVFTPTPIPSPEISAIVISTPTPLQTLSVIPVPSITPTPVVAIASPLPISTPIPSPTVSVVVIPSTGKVDKLQNGSDLLPTETKYKFIFKALADLTVQYRCDDKTLMKFTLRKDRILVLKGKEAIRLQVSNPNSIGLSKGAAGYIPLSESKSKFDYKGVATFVQPLELKDKMSEKWEGATPLQKTPDPAIEGASEGNPVEMTAPTPSLSPTP